MKLVIFSNFYNYAGLENYTFNIVNEILSKDPNFAIELIVSNTKGDFPFKNEFIKLNVKIHQISSPKNPFKFKSELSKLLKTYDKNTIFHINLCSMKNFLLLHTFKHSKKNTLIVSHYTHTVGKFGFLHYINRLMFNKFATNVAVSDHAGKFMYGNAKYEVIENGILESKFIFNSEFRQEIRNKYKLDNNFVIGQIGRFSNEKNQSFSIELYKKLKLKYENIKMVLVGNNNCDKLKKLAIKLSLNLNDIIFISGSDIPAYKWYSAFDMFILPSKHEAFSLCIPESLANGLKIIASTKIKDKVTSNFITYTDLDLNKWTEEIGKILNKNDENDRKSQLSPQFKLENCVERYLKLYNKISYGK